jgi:hypothetical protein
MMAYMLRDSHVGNARAAPSVPERGSASSGPGLREALVIWGIVAVDVLLIVVTYTRLDPSELYNTSVGGLRGGLGRALVTVNFPVSLVALGLLGVVANALLDTHRRLVVVMSAIAVPLCLLTAFVVDQDDLDAALGNALPAVGVLLIAVLTVIAVRRVGVTTTPAARGDPLRIVLIALLALIAIPWIFASLGFYAPGPIYADEPSPGEPIPAVHLGAHHGLDGVLVALTGVVLSRALPSFRHARLTRAVSPLLALAVAYGFANALQDFTLEQLWKRGTIGWKPPAVLLPSITWGWLAVLAAAAVIEIGWFRREQRG